MYILSKHEESILKNIIKCARYDYIKNNEIYSEMIDIDSIEVETKKNLYEVVTDKFDMEVQASELELIFTEKNIYRKIKALTYKEKLVLFLFYIEGLTDSKIAKELNVKLNTVTQIRMRTIKRIIGEMKDV